MKVSSQEELDTALKTGELMILPNHPTATQMAIEQHLKSAFEATGLLAQAMADHPLRFMAISAYEDIAFLMTKLKLKTQPKPRSTRTH